MITYAKNIVLHAEKCKDFNESKLFHKRQKRMELLSLQQLHRI